MQPGASFNFEAVKAQIQKAMAAKAGDSLHGGMMIGRSVLWLRSGRLVADTLWTPVAPNICFWNRADITAQLIHFRFWGLHSGILN